MWQPVCVQKLSSIASVCYMRNCITTIFEHISSVSALQQFTGPMTAETKRFNLPRDYYVPVNPLITVAVVSVMWLALPTLAFFPNALDAVINDSVGDFIERNRYNLIKLFNVQVWVC